MSEEKKDSTSIDVAEVLADSHENLLSTRKLVMVFSGMALALLLSFVDQTSITILLPYMGEEFDAEDTISWAGTASLMSTTAFMVMFGRFADIFSRKYVLVAGMIILAVFDLACGLARNQYQLFVFRGFCGIGNGAITSLTMTIVSDVVTLQQRGKYQGILGSCVGIGNAIGPFLASAFLSRTSSWRNLYYFMCPTIIAASLVIVWLVPYTRPDISLKEKLAKIDYLGFFFSSVAIIFILIPISGGGSYFKWSNPMVISFLVIGVVALGVFLVIEKKVAVLPMIPLKLFHTNYSLTILLLQNFFFGMAYYGNVFYYPYYFQMVRDKSVVNTSLFLLCLVLPQATTSVICGQVISRTGHYIFVVWYGYSCWLIGMCLLVLWGNHTNIGVVIISLIINGSGIGAIFQPTLVAAQAKSFKKDRAVVISTRNVLRSLGGAAGLAVGASILSNGYISFLKDSHGLFTAEELLVLRSKIYTVLFSQFSPEQVTYLRMAYMKGLKNVFYYWIGCMSVCLVSSVVIRDRGLKSLDDN